MENALKKEHETPLITMNAAEECLKEINVILAKYNCEMISEKAMIYGQRIYVPSVAVKPTQK